MSALRSYLLCVVCSGFLVALVQGMVKGKGTDKILSLAAGCFLILVVLGPLTRIDFGQLSIDGGDLGLSEEFDSQTAKEKNLALMGDLVAKQTASAIEAKAESLGISITAQVETAPTEDSEYPVPCGVVLLGQCTERQKHQLSAYIADELGIPLAQQEWREK